MQTVVGLAGLGVSFALMYPTLLAKLSLSLVSPYVKAESRRRLFAATIDGLLVASMFVLYWSSASIAFPAIGAVYILLRDAVAQRPTDAGIFAAIIRSRMFLVIRWIRASLRMKSLRGGFWNPGGVESHEDHEAHDVHKEKPLVFVIFVVFVTFVPPPWRVSAKATPEARYRTPPRPPRPPASAGGVRVRIARGSSDMAI
jgi:hypothetical protein